MAVERVDERIGISTHFMPKVYNESIYDAIQKVSQAKFSTFEIVPTEDQAQIGWPVNHPNIGITPKLLNREDRQKLREALEVFKLVTIHSPHLDLNIASSNRDIRRTTKEIYDECIQLAVNLDVKIVTFHPGHSSSGYIRLEDEIIKYEIEYGKSILKKCRNHGIKIGYEVCAPFKHMCRIIDGIGEGFGLNFDIGHALMAENNDDFLEKYATHFNGRILEVHMNGINHHWNKFMEHQPPRMNNAIDYQAVFTRLKSDGFEGPIICEIQGNDLPQAIGHCQEAKDMICGIWNGKIHLRNRWNDQVNYKNKGGCHA